MTTVYLNGAFIAQDQATISVMDRGFLFGDGVYEVLPVYNGNIFRFEQHITRLNRSLSAITLPLNISFKDWEDLLYKLLDLNSEFGKNQSIYLQITRGYSAERNHAFPKELKPTIFALSCPIRTLPYDQLCQGMSAITLQDTRWQLCNIKATSLLANVLLYQEALNHHCAESILIRDGTVLEGATSNVFIVSNAVIKTPPLSQFILGGVTRDLILQLAKDHHLPHEESTISEHELVAADEVWITSSTREIYPIVKINETVIKTGKPGKVWYEMINLYREYVKNI